MWIQQPDLLNWVWKTVKFLQRSGPKYLCQFMREKWSWKRKGQLRGENVKPIAFDPTDIPAKTLKVVMPLATNK